MNERILVALYRFGDPRQVAVFATLLLLILALAGCGDVIPACPSGGSSGSGCTGG